MCKIGILSWWIPVEGTCESNLQLQVEPVILPIAPQYVIACYCCKVVIYNHVFVGFNFVPNLIVIIFNLMYHVLFVGFHCKGYVRERERERE